MSTIHAVEGGIVLSKQSVIAIVSLCIADPLNSKSSMFDAGAEEMKRRFAEVIRRELNIDTGLNPARHILKVISDGK